MRRILALTILFLLMVSASNAQRWKRYRHEAFFSVGASSMLGELGGGGEEARDLFFDFNAAATRYALSGGYRYKLNEVISARGNLSFMQLHASDALSGDVHRESRNIIVYTPLFEMAALAEVYFIREKLATRYRIRGIRGALSSTLSAYFNFGVSGFFFNPRGEFNGNRYSLQPLGTEGQTIAGATTGPYSRISLGFPVGGGLKFSLSKNLSLTFEYNFRLTATDYLDDTSTRYPNPDDVAAANGGYGTPEGDAAAYFSNPAFRIGDVLAGGLVPQGQQRGDDTTNDTYMFAVVGINYKFVSKKSNRPKF